MAKQIKVREDNYFAVQGWMVTELKLKGNALMLYAIIYGFSQTTNTAFTGSVDYLCEWLGGVSRPTVINTLDNLVKQGLLTKSSTTKGALIYNSYTALRPSKKILSDEDPTSKKTLPDTSKNFLLNKVLFYAFLLPAFVGMMFSCSDVKTDVKKLEGKWNVVEVKGEKVLEEGLPQMDFNMAEKKLHGNTGCNLFNTTITLDPEDVSSITIAPGATTMMACPNMDLETSVLQSMDQVRSVKAGKDENEMLLVDQDGNVLLVLERN